MNEKKIIHLKKKMRKNMIIQRKNILISKKRKKDKQYSRSIKSEYKDKNMNIKRKKRKK